MKIIKLKVKAENQKYPIFIGNNILKSFQILLKKNSINFNQCLVIIDKNVPKKLINIENSLKYCFLYKSDIFDFQFL